MAIETLIRPAAPDDSEAIGDVFIAARADALPGVASIHTEAEIRAYLARVVADTTNTVWVAGSNRTVVGFLSLRDDWVDHLYLRPGWYRQQIGTLLLNIAKQERPRGLTLYCFRCNHRARAFYEAGGFVAMRMTDGSGNEEQEPDMEYAWAASTASTPLPLRGRGQGA